MIELDKNSYPILREDTVNLAIISKIAEGRPGNDFHDPRTGRFTFVPAGVKVMKGEELLKLISRSEQARLFRYSQMAKPNQLIAQMINGKLQITLLRDGRKLAAFGVATEKPVEGEGQAKATDKEGAEGLTAAPTGELRDMIVDAARDLSLTSDALKNFIKERSKGELSPGDLITIERQIKAERLNMFLDWIHQRLRVAVKKERIKDTVRIAVGRGFAKKIFVNMDKDEVQEIITRLGARGWSEAIIQDHVIDSLPRKTKKILNVKHKEATIEK